MTGSRTMLEVGWYGIPELPRLLRKHTATSFLRLLQNKNT